MPNKRELIFLSGLSTAVLLSIWNLVAESHIVSTIFLPSPVAVVAALQQLFVAHGFFQDVWTTLLRVAVGFVVAVVMAIPIGMGVGASKRFEALLEPSINAIRYVPISAFLPLFIVWFGVGELEKVVVIWSAIFFQLVLMVATAVAMTPIAFIESAQALGASYWQIIRSVIYPAIQPRVWDDLRISLGWAWSSVILAEVVGSTEGIGSVIVQSQRLLRTDQVIAAMLIIGLLGLSTDFVMKRLHRVLFPWTPRGIYA